MLSGSQEFLGTGLKCYLYPFSALAGMYFQYQSMQNKIFRLLRTLHAWGGVTLSLLFIVVSLTGSLLVWKSEYLLLTIPEARVEFSPTPEALSLIANAIEEQFDANDILSIQFATEQLPLTYVIMAESYFAYLDTEGNVIDQWQGNGRWEEWLYDLHHRLLLENIGLSIVGFGSMAMVILLLAGIASFWPRRKGFRHGLWPKNTSRMQLLSTHRNLGILVALPFLLTLVTGIVQVFPAQTEELLLESARSTEQYSMNMVKNLDDISGGNSGDWLPAMQRALAVFPESTIRSAQVPGDFSFYRILGLQQSEEWNPKGQSVVYIDAYEGYMDIRIDAMALPGMERIYNTAYPLHTGKIDLLWYKILLTLSGLCIFVISSVGLISFIKKFKS